MEGVKVLYLGGWATSQRGPIPRTPATDFAPPLIIPDGDIGYRGEHHIRILVKKFVESKIGAIHIEDQRSGCKVCGHQRQKVLVSTAEIISRLNTARLQYDIMQVLGVIVGRTDAHDATAIDSVDHERDHLFVYGATDPHAVPFKNVNLAVIRKFYREGFTTACSEKLEPTTRISSPSKSIPSEPRRFSPAKSRSSDLSRESWKCLGPMPTTLRFGPRQVDIRFG